MLLSTDRCDVCNGSRTVMLPVYGLTVTDFGMTDEATDTPRMKTGERRYPCPECTKPVTPPEARERYTIIRANKLLRTDYLKDASYVENMEGNLAALIGRVMRDRGLIQFTQTRLPSYDPRNDTALEAFAGAVWPKGEEREREIYDLDPATRSYKETYPPPPPPEDPRYIARRARRAPREPPIAPRIPGLRELIFDDEKPVKPS